MEGRLSSVSFRITQFESKADCSQTTAKKGIGIMKVCMYPLRVVRSVMSSMGTYVSSVSQTLSWNEDESHQRSSCYAPFVQEKGDQSC